MSENRSARRIHPNLADGNTSAEIDMINDLDALYMAPEPPAHLNASITWAIRERAAERRKAPRPQRWFDPGRWMPRRLATVAVSLLAVVILAGAGYAGLPVLQEAFNMNTGTDEIITSDLGSEVHVSQTVDGFTVTVERVYADPHQIVIGYTIQGPEGRQFNHIMAWSEYEDEPAGRAIAPLLTDMQGNEIHGGLAPQGPGMQDGVAAGLLTFDGTVIPDDEVEIDVRLRIKRLSAYERLGNDRFQEVVVDGPMVFELTIPVVPGRVANLNQSVEAGGSTATLVRFVTTATGTRVSLQGVGPNADVRLMVDGDTYRLRPEERVAPPTRWERDSTWQYVTGTSLEDKQGNWVLSVAPGGPVVPASIDPLATQATGGPWEFRFVVP